MPFGGPQIGAQKAPQVRGLKDFCPTFWPVSYPNALRSAGTLGVAISLQRRAQFCAPGAYWALDRRETASWSLHGLRTNGRFICWRQISLRGQFGGGHRCRFEEWTADHSACSARLRCYARGATDFDGQGRPDWSNASTPRGAVRTVNGVSADPTASSRPEPSWAVQRIPGRKEDELKP